MAFDYLVNLYQLTADPEEESLKKQGISIVRPLSPDYHLVQEFIQKEFSENWSSEATNGLYQNPAHCYIAVCNQQIVGFACYDATCKGFFGPTGVKEDFRHKGIGKALLLKCLYSMKEEGYAYAVIGSVGPAKFYETVCNASKIESSDEYNIYSGRMVGYQK